MCHNTPTPMRWDHPRVCGEKTRAVALSLASVGSPPRVRGKVVMTEDTVTYYGITPACAGKSPTAASACPPVQDHPRVCGEKCLVVALGLGGPGSPPRVRGKEAVCPAYFVPIGITPACAGKRLKKALKNKGF